MATDLELAYEHCQRVARSEAKNFYYGFRTLPVRQRRSIYAAYAFCRICDDIADGTNPLEEKRRLLAGTRQSLLRSKNDAVSDPTFAALADTLCDLRHSSPLLRGSDRGGRDGPRAHLIQEL